MSLRKRKNSSETLDKQVKKVRRGINFYIPLHKLNLSNDIKNDDENDGSSEEKTYTQTEVTALLNKQQSDFRKILEEKLKEQFLMFNQFYINNIFKEYEKNEFSYIG
jgi:hypothetical protein